MLQHGASKKVVLGPVAPALEVPELEGPAIYLKPLTTDDYRFLHVVETAGHLGPRWRFRGSTPTPEQWATALSSALAQFLIISRQGHEPIGLVAVYQANFQDGHAYLAAAQFEPRRRSSSTMLGLALFVDYVFACWNFRKLYLEVPGFNLHQFASALDGLVEEEGRLRDHLFAGGRTWDQHILGLHRRRWEELGGSFVAAARGESNRRPTDIAPDREEFR